MPRIIVNRSHVETAVKEKMRTSDLNIDVEVFLEANISVKANDPLTKLVTNWTHNFAMDTKWCAVILLAGKHLKYHKNIVNQVFELSFIQQLMMSCTDGCANLPPFSLLNHIMQSVQVKGSNDQCDVFLEGYTNRDTRMLRCLNRCIYVQLLI